LLFSLFNLYLSPEKIDYTTKRRYFMEKSQAINELGKKLNKDIEILDTVYSDMVEAIHLKPQGNELEELRLYVDNLYTMLNRTVFRIQEVKNSIAEEKQLLLETWNPPA